jgi:hypothetical protein
MERTVLAYVSSIQTVLTANECPEALIKAAKAIVQPALVHHDRMTVTNPRPSTMQAAIVVLATELEDCPWFPTKEEVCGYFGVAAASISEILKVLRRAGNGHYELALAETKRERRKGATQRVMERINERAAKVPALTKAKMGFRVPDVAAVKMMDVDEMI